MELYFIGLYFQKDSAIRLCNTPSSNSTVVYNNLIPKFIKHKENIHSIVTKQLFIIRRPCSAGAD